MASDETTVSLVNGFTNRLKDYRVLVFECFHKGRFKALAYETDAKSSTEDMRAFFVKSISDELGLEPSEVERIIDWGP